MTGSGDFTKLNRSFITLNDGGDMRYAFLFGPIALTVRHHVAHAPDGDERGARVEIQRLEEEVPDNESKSWVTSLTDPIWRADLFSFVPGAPGNWDRAHFHSRFDGWVPAETDQFMGRDWDPELTADPVGWTRRQLADVRAILVQGRAPDLAANVDQAEIDAALPAIVDAVQKCLKQSAETATASKS